MIFTVIGIILRCLAETAWRPKENLQGLCNVLFVIYIVFCVMGIIETCLGRYERPATATVLLFIIQIVASVYFTVSADSLISKVIGCIGALLVFSGVMSIFSGGSSTSGTGVRNTSDDLNILDEFCKSESTYDKWDREQKEREQYVRDNWDRNLGRLNSDATMYETPDGNWNKISKDGKSYEDDSGNWKNL